MKMGSRMETIHIKAVIELLKWIMESNRNISTNEIVDRFVHKFNNKKHLMQILVRAYKRGIIHRVGYGLYSLSDVQNIKNEINQLTKLCDIREREYVKSEPVVTGKPKTKRLRLRKTKK